MGSTATWVSMGGGIINGGGDKMACDDSRGGGCGGLGNDASVIEARGGGGNGGRRGSGTNACGGWSPSSIFLEQLLKREITPFLSQVTARVCGGGGPFPSYRVQDGPRGDRAHLRPTTLKPNIIIINKGSQNRGKWR